MIRCRSLLLLLLFSACAALGEAVWLTPLAEQSDPARLATLGKRGANPRVNRILFHLHQAHISGVPVGDALDAAFRLNGTTGLVATLGRETQLRNYRHATDWGLLTPENLADLKSGEAPRITRGPHAGEDTDVDHIVPVSLAPEAGNALANLELLPASVNRSKGARIGWREVKFAAQLRDAGIVSGDSLMRVRWAFCRTAVLPWLGLLTALAVAWRMRRKRPAGGLALVLTLLQRLLRSSARRGR